MKVLLVNRPTQDKLWGGDCYQLLLLYEQLKKLNVRLLISNDTGFYKGFDILHYHNLQLGTTIEQVEKGLSTNSKVVLSTIFWWGSFFFVNSPYSFQRVKRILEKCFLVTTSYREKWFIEKSFGVNPDKVFVCELPAEYREPSDVFYVKHNIKDFIGCVGRIEPGKNQHSLLLATKELNTPIVFIGKYEEGSPYYNKCKELGGIYLNHLSMEETISAYKYMKVHCLPSLSESLGLATLEAYQYGVNTVTSFESPIFEYLGNKVWYCNPEDIDSIRFCVLEALQSEKIKAEIVHTKESYGKKMFEIYERILKWD